MARDAFEKYCGCAREPFLQGYHQGHKQGYKEGFEKGRAEALALVRADSAETGREKTADAVAGTQDDASSQKSSSCMPVSPIPSHRPHDWMCTDGELTTYLKASELDLWKLQLRDTGSDSVLLFPPDASPIEQQQPSPNQPVASGSTNPREDGSAGDTSPAPSEPELISLSPPSSPTPTTTTPDTHTSSSQVSWQSASRDALLPDAAGQGARRELTVPGTLYNIPPPWAVQPVAPDFDRPPPTRPPYPQLEEAPLRQEHGGSGSGSGSGVENPWRVLIGPISEAARDAWRHDGGKAYLRSKLDGSVLPPAVDGGSPPGRSLPAGPGVLFCEMVRDVHGRWYVVTMCDSPARARLALHVFRGYAW